MRELSMNSAKEALRYKDEKSDKFWRIEYAGNTLAVNHGKTGTIGKYLLKEFDTEGDCEKEAGKLIASKIKKGYMPYPEFDMDNHIYIDDDEIGLHPLTSHPKYRAFFNNELYYCCVTEWAPFGSDEGDISLYEFCEEIRKQKGSFDMAAFIKSIIDVYDSWDVPLPVENITKESFLSEELDLNNIFICDVTAYATAFAQIKTTGRLDAELKKMALNAMKRRKIAAEILEWGEKPIKDLMTMIEDLTKFEATI